MVDIDSRPYKAFPHLPCTRRTCTSMYNGGKQIRPKTTGLSFRSILESDGSHYNLPRFVSFPLDVTPYYRRSSEGEHTLHSSHSSSPNDSAFWGSKPKYYEPYQKSELSTSKFGMVSVVDFGMKHSKVTACEGFNGMPDQIVVLKERKHPATRHPLPIRSFQLDRGSNGQARSPTLVDVRVRERDISELVELLAPYAYKWREIGTRLGFSQHELNNIEYHRQEPGRYLTAMLSQWVEWTRDGPHHDYATFWDLRMALKSQTVDLGDDAGDVCTKLLEMGMERLGEEFSEMFADDEDTDTDDDDYFTCDESDDQDKQATTKQGLLSKMRKGVRKLFGAAKDMTAGFIKKAIKTLNLDVMVTRKYKKRHDKYTNRDVARWWFEIWGDEAALQKMEAQWEKEVAAKHKWRLETCPVVSQSK